MGLLLLLAAQLIDAHDVLVADLGPLQGAYHHVGVVAADERELAAQLALVLRCMEGAQRTVEHRGLLRGIDHVERSLMAYDAVGEHVVALVLMSLVDIAAMGLGGIEQRQAHGVVVGLVPAVARVVEEGDAILARTVGQVGPLVAVHLVGLRRVVATLHLAQTYVVRGLLVADAQRELGLQQSILSPPVHHVLEVDAVGLCTLIEAYVLAYVGLSVFLGDAQRLAQWSVLGHSHLYAVVYGQRLLVERALVNLPCRPGLRLTVVEDDQPYALAWGHQFAFGPLVVERLDVAVGIHAEGVD